MAVVLLGLALLPPSVHSRALVVATEELRSLPGSPPPPPRPFGIPIAVSPAAATPRTAAAAATKATSTSSRTTTTTTTLKSTLLPFNVANVSALSLSGNHSVVTSSSGTVLVVGGSGVGGGGGNGNGNGNNKNNNVSLEVPQGDQPGPPYTDEDGAPVLPSHWRESTNRTMYLQNRYGKYLEMWPNGHTRGVAEKSPFCIFELLSQLPNVVMKGLVGNKFLCMNSTTSVLYTRAHVHEDCYIKEAVRNGSGNIVYSFSACRTREGKKCYLGMYRNGTMRPGQVARQSQNTAKWMVKPAPEDETKDALDERESINKRGGVWTPPTLPPVSQAPRPVVSQKERKRKRVRRWCRNLTVIRVNPRKFRDRCKRDCEVLEGMIAAPERSMRHCLQSLVRRRARNKSRKAGAGAGGADKPQEVDSDKIRKQVQRLWPKRDDIFRRLRRLRRCNRNRRRRRGEKRHSCSKKELRRYERSRRRHREKTAEAQAQAQGQAPSPRTRSRSGAGGAGGQPRRTRHGGKRRRKGRRTGGKKKKKKKKTKKEEKEVSSSEKEDQTETLLVTVLTSR